MKHHENCDANDANPDGIRKPCNCWFRDHDGETIRRGSVIQNVEDGDRGVVVEILKAGMMTFIFGGSDGDLVIQTGRGTQRITNCYSKWRHVPKSEQTYCQRWLSWLKSGPIPAWFKPDEDEGTRTAINGVLALLPEGTVDYRFENEPCTVEEALELVAKHLDKLTEGRAK